MVRRVPEAAFDTILSLHKTADDARLGTGMVGTGFLLGVPADLYKNWWHIYAVTAYHVLGHGNNWVRRMTGKAPETHAMTTHDWFWDDESSDIAIAHLGMLQEVRQYPELWVPSDWLLKESEVGLVAQYGEGEGNYDVHGPGPGDTAYIVGHFALSRSVGESIVVVRTGIISSFPADLRVEWLGRDHQVILVEMRSIGGFSGAPVFASDLANFEHGGRSRVSHGLGLGKILGVDIGHRDREQTVRDTVTDHVLSFKENTGLAMVAPAWKLAELLEDSDGCKKRASIEAEQSRVLADRPSTASL